jgi:hypothetical protein
MTFKSEPAVKKRKVTFDAANAPGFLEENFDLARLAASLKGVEDLDGEEVKRLILSALKGTTVRSPSPQAIGFSAVSPDHLKPFRETGQLLFKPGEEETLSKIGNAILEEYRTYRERVGQVVWPRVSHLFLSQKGH